MDFQSNALPLSYLSIYLLRDLNSHFYHERVMSYQLDEKNIIDKGTVFAKARFELASSDYETDKLPLLYFTEKIFKKLNYVRLK